jgi:hypothetical protein
MQHKLTQKPTLTLTAAASAAVAFRSCLLHSYELQGTESTDAALVDTAPTQTLTAAAAAAAAVCST